MQKLEELKLKEAEILAHLDMLDIIFNTDCTQDGVPLTKEQWEKLWKENAEWENKLLLVRLAIDLLTNPVQPATPLEKKQQLHALINTADDSGCDTNLHHKKDTGLER